MTSHIALLRAINLAGRNQVAMTDLRELLVQLGFVNVRSLLQTGNLVFEGRARSSGGLEGLLEREVFGRLGLRTDVFVRSAKDWKTIVSGNPFRQEAERDPAHLLVVFLKDAPTAKAVDTLQDAISGREVVRARGRHAYVVYPDGIGRSRLTNAVIEKHLGTRGTARNWNTVLKLGALAHA